jgi:L-amino acid N-acyltransferase YncA
MDTWTIRKVQEKDWARIQAIYNQGIEDRIATLEEQPKSLEEVKAWCGFYLYGNC